MLEMLITVGIIAALAALSLVGILKARKRGIEIRARSDLALIGTALEAYKTDFGDYPRLDDAATDVNGNKDVSLLNWQGDRGARLLCRALLGPGPASDGGLPGFIASANQRGPDGADGPGFRIRAGGYGKVYGPYIDATKFKLGNSGVFQSDGIYFVDATLLDQNGNSILYYPGFSSAVITGGNGAYVTPLKPQGVGTPVTRPMYNAFDNNYYGESASGDTRIPTRGYLLDPVQMAFILGDRHLNGYIGSGDTAVTTQPYLLWTAGPDGKYGFGLDPATGKPLAITANQTGLKTDDITNFDMPADLKQ
jgi:type II secretory pathway pseudopilin PulG